MARLIYLENKPGERMAIVIDPISSKSGVLILVDRQETTGPFVVFTSDKTKKFPIVSLRRPPELCGIDEPENFTAQELEKWTRPYREQFCRSLAQACKKANVKILFLAASSSWDQSPYTSLINNIMIKNATKDIEYT